MGFFCIGNQRFFFGQFESTIARKELFRQFLDPESIFHGVCEDDPVIGVPDKVVPGVSLPCHGGEGVLFLHIVDLSGMLFPLRGDVLIEIV